MKKLFIVALLALVFSLSVQADRLFTSGFEENNLLETIWSSTSGTSPPTVQTTTVRSGTYAARSQTTVQSSIVNRDLPTALTSGTLFVRFYYRVAAFSDISPSRLMSITNVSGNTVLRAEIIDVAGDKRIRLHNQVTSTSTDETTFDLATNTWYRIEVRHLFSNTVGELELRHYTGDSTTLDFTALSITGEDTINPNIDRISFGHGSTDTHDHFYDDIAINDDNGTFQNTFPGPGKIAFQEAASDNSITWERVPTDTTNWDRVDDLPGTPDDSTTYTWEAVTLNSVDRLNAGTLPAEVTSDATITLVDVYGRVGSDQASAAAMRLKLWEEDATLTDGPTVATGLNGWRIIDTDEHLVFDASGKSKANVESFDYGYENITDDATRARRITALWVNVEWLEVVAAGGIGITGPIVITGPIKVTD